MFAVKPDICPRVNTLQSITPALFMDYKAEKKYFLEMTIRRNRPTTNYAKNLTT